MKGSCLVCGVNFQKDSLHDKLERIRIQKTRIAKYNERHLASGTDSRIDRIRIERTGGAERNARTTSPVTSEEETKLQTLFCNSDEISSTTGQERRNRHRVVKTS
ncbi:hypothetical protein L3Y34_003785 [Caenorhabditis briggsae]|uniref:Uncharacterized protein n=1 Tax=Caenorhabditis briggsae TaxID=6238 RepID=A0AAE9AA74_CAEBR|nr:hypothetical protein L3Y34_003785 [Caenorhabditis briggsae]